MFAQGFENLNTTKLPAGNTLPGGKIFSGATSGSSGGFKSVMETLMSKGMGNTTDGVPNLKSMMNCQGVLCKNGNELIALLGRYFDFNGMGPDMLKMDDDGLASLGKLLKGLGFGNENVDGFLKSLKGDGTSSGIGMKSLLSRLGEFIRENDTHSETDISSLPYIVSMLSGLGIRQEKIQALMSEAGGGKGSIDLDLLVSRLKRIASNADNFNQGSAMADGVTGGGKLMEGLGLKAGENGKVTLEDFIAKLETLTARNGEKTLSDPAAESLARAISDSIHASKRNGPGSGGGNGLNGMGGWDSDMGGFRFDKGAFKHQQHMGDNSFERNLLNAKMNKFQEPGLMKDAPAAFDKSLKEFSSQFKPSDDSGFMPGRAVAGPEMVDRVSGYRNLVYTEKNLPSYVTGQVERQIALAVRKGESEVRFQIKPPDLGRIQLSIETTNTGMRVTILAEQGATKDMLLSNASELKNLLSDQGIRLEKLDVDVSGQFGQSTSNARHGADQSGKEKKNKGKQEFSLDENQGEIQEDPGMVPIRHRKGTLDLVA